MNAIISKAQLMAITVIFAAALLASLVGEFHLVTKMGLDLMSKYDTAVTSTLGSSVYALEQSGTISFADAEKMLYFSEEHIANVTIRTTGNYFGTTTITKPVDDITPYLTWLSSKFCTATVSKSGNSYNVTLQEVAP